MWEGDDKKRTIETKQTCYFLIRSSSGGGDSDSGSGSGSGSGSNSGSGSGSGSAGSAGGDDGGGSGSDDDDDDGVGGGAATRYLIGTTGTRFDWFWLDFNPSHYPRMDHVDQPIGILTDNRSHN